MPDRSGINVTDQTFEPKNVKSDCEYDVVITGISGRFPESSNVDEFKKNLFENIDMVTDDERRWSRGLYGLPERSGKLKNEDLESFDQAFFNVHEKQSSHMDAQMRILLEITHEAIVDAGINPREMRGSRTGVYIAISSSESEEYWFRDPDLVNGYGLTGHAKAMFPNRVSFTYDFKGPSYCIDTACSSSIYALTNAFLDIKSGRCDAAIVAGVNLTLRPSYSLQFKRLSMLSPDGACKSFDESGDGYARADACVAILVQKSKDARRIYTTILNAKTNCDGYKEQGITFPEGRMQNLLIRETYKEIGLDPRDISYIEAHGTGTKVGDPQEINSVTDFFCKNRKTPLLMGTVKSNMGHSEPSSGLCSIAKIILAMENGLIPANLHFKKANPDLKGIVKGQLKVVDKNIQWNAGIVAMNSFGFGGANGHVIFAPNPKQKVKKEVFDNNLAKLVVCSGRTDEAVRLLLEEAEINKNDDEYLNLINEVHKSNIPLHPYRGFVLLNENRCIYKEVLESHEKRPIWFIYSGMGSQWGKMAKDFMRFEVFKKSIYRSADVMRAEGIDLLSILLNSDDSTFDKILYSFVGIAACQIALTDILFDLNIRPDGMIGHSVGELGCAYADSCFTAEQTILASYWRGRSIIDTELMKGKMAAVGLSWEECHKILPPEIIPVCHNSGDNVTISGPEDSVVKIVEKLSSDGIFAKEVNSSGYAFHSKYIAEAGPKLRQSLNKIIPEPKIRSSKWISTSVPKSAWNSSIAKLSSASYHVNNLLSPVLFHEGLQHVPDNAICVEIAPHGLLQAILRRTLSKNCTNISLAKKYHKNNAEFLITNIGKLYVAGANPTVTKLMEPISYPVSRGTPMLGSKIRWNHSEKWFVPDYSQKVSGGQTTVDVKLENEEEKFLMGHNIDGRILYPATGYLIIAWRIFAKIRNSEIEKSPVVIENVTFHRATILTKESSIKFAVNFFDGSGKFEICENGNLVVSGFIRLSENISKEEFPRQISRTDHRSGLNMNIDDIYKELRLRGYDYSGLFRGVVKSDAKLKLGELKWENNWITFMDTMLQFSILSTKSREIYLPTFIEKIILNPMKQLETVSKLTNEKPHIPVNYNSDVEIIESGGVQIKGLKATITSRRPCSQTSPILEKYCFIPQFRSVERNEKIIALTIAIGLVIENAGGALKIKVTEILNQNTSIENILAPTIFRIIESEPVLAADISIAVSDMDINQLASKIKEEDIKIINRNISETEIDQNCQLIVASDILSRPDYSIAMQNIVKSLKRNGFLLLEENVNCYRSSDIFRKLKLKIVQEQIYGERVIILAREKVDILNRNKIVIHLTEQNYNWLNKLKAALCSANADNRHVYLVCQGEELFGAVGLMNCIKNEIGGKLARMYFIQDNNIEKFNFTSKFFMDQFENDLIMNIFKNGQWGSYRHIQLPTENQILPVEHSYVNALVKGDLSSLNWVESSLSKENNYDPSYELCTVYYSALNFRDVMMSTGKIGIESLPAELRQEECVLGIECSGRNSKGKRVMCVLLGKALATSCLVKKNALIEIPDNWTMEEASTVPCVYMTVYLALVVRGRMLPGEKILIHCGAGGIGIAAITVALHHGLQVFTTVGSDDKREFLKTRFPQLKNCHIGYSRDTSFEQMIMHETNGQGVDLVLNSLSEEKLQASVRCLGINGRFLEIGKFDLMQNNLLGMSVFSKNTSFHGVLLDQVITRDNDLQELVSLVSKGIKNGAVQPLPTTVFNENQVEQAFRFLASGKHIGKIVIKIRNEEPLTICKAAPKFIKAIPRTYLYKNKSYIIIGGLGGFGLELSNWLILRGCKNLVLNSRKGIVTGYQSLMVRRWQEQGIKVLIDTNDVATKSGCLKVIDNGKKLGQIGGIFNLAVVLCDDLIEHQTEDNFRSVCTPKINVTKFLDVLSQDLCPTLDYFVCFSSVSCGRGNIGQTNYGMANSVMERICENRQASGFPATAIQWGAVGDTGIIIQNLGDNDTVISGTLPQRMNSCLRTLDMFLQTPHPVLASMVIAEKRKTETSSASILSFITSIMGLRDINNIADTTSLADISMDSLMGTEIKQTFERNFDIIMSPQEIRNLTFGDLRKMDNKTCSKLEICAMDANNDKNLVNGYDATITFNPELIPNETIICLNKGNMKKALPIFMIHPIEGFAEPLIPLAININRPVYGLQCSLDAPLDSADSLSKFYIEKIKKLQAVGPYLIVGYSFGALIAYVMAVQLEKIGEKAQIIMLDGAPKYVHWRLDIIVQQRNKLNDSHTNEALGLSYFCALCGDLDYTKVCQNLLKSPTYKSKLEKTAQLLQKVHNKPINLITTAANSFYQKLLMGNNFESNSKIQSDVILMKATEDSTDDLVDDYELSKICQKKVEVISVKGNHRTFITEQESINKISEIINNFKF